MSPRKKERINDIQRTDKLKLSAFKLHCSGVHACKLYNPYDNKCIVEYGTCKANVGCPYKIAELKTQECEELKNEICNLGLGINGDIKPKVFGKSLEEIREALLLNNRYKQALDKIEGICSQDRTIVNVCLISTQLEEPRVKYDIQDEILDIISKAKGEENDR